MIDLRTASTIAISTPASGGTTIATRTSIAIS